MTPSQLRISSTLLAVASMLASRPGAATPPASGANTFRLVADVGGPIQTLAVQLSDVVATTAIADIVRALPNALVLAVVDVGLEDDLTQALTSRLGRHATRVRFLPLDSPFTLWTRDTFVPLRRGPGRLRLLLRPEQLDTRDEFADRRAPELLAPLTRADIMEADLYVEGGNLLSDDRWAYVGYNAIHQNVSQVEYQAEFEYRLSRQLGAPVMLVGSSEEPTPHAHIDMYLAPLGDGSVVVGDQTLAIRAIEAASGRELAQVEARFSQRGPGYDGKPFSFAELVALNARPAFADRLDRVAQALIARGIRVHRVPVLVAGEDMDLPVISYTNVLLERRPVRVVLLPEYGIPSLDAAARQAWTALGYAVRPIDVSRIADLGGAVRCLTQVLERGRERVVRSARPTSRRRARGRGR